MKKKPKKKKKKRNKKKTNQTNIEEDQFQFKLKLKVMLYFMWLLILLPDDRWSPLMGLNGVIFRCTSLSLLLYFFFHLYLFRWLIRNCWSVKWLLLLIGIWQKFPDRLLYNGQIDRYQRHLRYILYKKNVMFNLWALDDLIDR